MTRLLHVLGHLFSCRDITRLVSQLRERPATRVERVKLRLHLAACAGCARFERQMATVDEAMRRYRR